MNNIESFVNYIFDRKENDSAFRATMKQSAIESLEWKSWSIIEKFIGNLSDKYKRESFILIGSAIAKCQNKSNGTTKLGKAMAIASKDKGNNEEFPPRFMRILSCSSIDELIDVLRPTLSFLNSKGIQLDYSDILSDIMNFRFEEDAKNKVKAKWASEFLSKEELNVSE